MADFPTIWFFLGLHIEIKDPRVFSLEGGFYWLFREKISKSDHEPLSSSVFAPKRLLKHKFHTKFYDPVIIRLLIRSLQVKIRERCRGRPLHFEIDARRQPDFLPQLDFIDLFRRWHQLRDRRTLNNDVIKAVDWNTHGFGLGRRTWKRPKFFQAPGGLGTVNSIKVASLIVLMFVSCKRSFILNWHGETAKNRCQSALLRWLRCCWLANAKTRRKHQGTGIRSVTGMNK